MKNEAGYGISRLWQFIVFLFLMSRQYMPPVLPVACDSSKYAVILRLLKFAAPTLDTVQSGDQNIDVGAGVV